MMGTVAVSVTWFDFKDFSERVFDTRLHSTRWYVASRNVFGFAPRRPAIPKKVWVNKFMIYPAWGSFLLIRFCERARNCEKTEPRRCPWTQQRVVSCASREGVCSWSEASGAEHRGSVSLAPNLTHCRVQPPSAVAPFFLFSPPFTRIHAGKGAEQPHRLWSWLKISPCLAPTRLTDWRKMSTR